MTDTTYDEGETFMEWTLDRLAECEIELDIAEKPRRFLICERTGDGDRTEVMYWGLEVPGGKAFARSGDGSSTHNADSARRIARLLDLVYDVDLVWLDHDVPERSADA